MHRRPGRRTAPAVDTNQAFLWNGVHWQQVTTEGKAGYIFGIGNLADYEVAAAKGRKLATVSRVFVDEMKTKTVMQIIQEVDKYYQDNPGEIGHSSDRSGPGGVYQGLPGARRQRGKRKNETDCYRDHGSGALGWAAVPACPPPNSGW